MTGKRQKKTLGERCKSCHVDVCNGCKWLYIFLFPNVSRQRRWQIKRRVNGLCSQCGEHAVTKGYCLKHAVRRREWLRVRNRCVKRYESKTYRLEKVAKGGKVL